MNDNALRAMFSALGTSLLALVIQQAKAKLRARRDKCGRGLAESFGHWLGRRWARRNKRT